MDNMDHNMPNMDMYHMQMWFYAGKDVIILWKKWEVQEEWQLALSCVFWFLLAVGYEGLKALRNELVEKLSQQKYVVTSSSSASVSVQGAQGLDVHTEKRSLVGSNGDIFSRIFCINHAVQTFLHLLQMAVGYLMMLVVMTFNVWLFVSVILGFTLGYFLFGWRNPHGQLNNEHH